MMSDKRFFLVNVIPFYEIRRFCFFFTKKKKKNGYSYKISHYYPFNIKKRFSIRLIQLLPFNDWFISEYLVSPDVIFDKFCSYFMTFELGTTYNIRECCL